jgi:glycosyltransferase involved in cell wall biosynthesis
MTASTLVANSISFPAVLAPYVAPATVPITARVLHVINGEHFSGAERVQQLLGRGLPKFGFEADFACVKPGKFPELCGLPEQRLISAPMHGRFDWRVVGQLLREVARRHIDILHAHTPRTALVASILAARTGLPWVYHVHSPTARDSTRGMVNRVNGWLESYCVRSCQQLITVSHSLQQEMLRRGVPQQRLSVVPNGVPAIAPIDARSRRHQSTWRLGLIALMRPRKGVEVALQAMKLLKQQQLPVTLELIGGFETPEYQRQTLELLRSLQLEDCVHWSGFTNDIPSAIRRLDALLLPSLFGEGMPMVVLEALAAAVPVVATRVEGTPEVVRDGIEGLLAEPGSASSLAERLCQLVSDREAWSAMSARALVRHRTSFSDERMAERTAAVYQRLL